MTDEAPKRKLLTKEGGLPTGNYPKEELVEYLRADRAHAMVAAAYEDAASVVSQAILSRPAAQLRARTPEAAEKALADLLKAEREKALRGAADIAKSAQLKRSECTVGGVIKQTRHNISASILALIEEKEPGHE